MWVKIIMPQLLRNLTNTSTELACTDDLFGLYLDTSRICDLTFCCCHSSLDLSWNQLQQLSPGVFSSLTSLRSLTSPVWLYVLRTCVYIAVFDFRSYHRQLKTKLHFRGRVDSNACEQSCTSFCQLYLASAPCTLMVTMTLLACVYAC
jgi:hypothetical protein